MDFDDEECRFVPGLPPALVSLTPFASSVSPSPRRLSSCFTQPSAPLRSKRQLAWVSLQGRLVGAEQATSAKTVDRNGAFTAEETMAWELFTPIQRVLTVAVVAAAAAGKSRKNKQISELQKSVELRDQVLLGMQKKLDNLCEQVNYFKDQPEVETRRDVFVAPEFSCKLCHHKQPVDGSLFYTPAKGSNSDEVFTYKMPYHTEADERRMSDLSDWAPSITSSVDILFDGSAVLERDEINILKKECEEKDVIIDELSTFLKSSELLGSKRIAELEDIIRRKNMIINKLRKDIIVMEQKVVNLTRLNRSSFSAANANLQRHPLMADNVLYDMESTTDPSSDSDSAPRNRTQVQISDKVLRGGLKVGHDEKSGFIEPMLSQRATSPLQEKSLNQTPHSVPVSKPKHTAYVNGENRRRRPAIRSNEVAPPPHKRWF